MIILKSDTDFDYIFEDYIFDYILVILITTDDTIIRRKTDQNVNKRFIMWKPAIDPALLPLCVQRISHSQGEKALCTFIRNKNNTPTLSSFGLTKEQNLEHFL